MKTKIINFCPEIRDAIINEGCSTVKVLNACNSALGELDVVSSKTAEKMGNARLTKTAFKISESITVTDTFGGEVSSIPLRFVAFHNGVEKVAKIASFELTLPETFKAWIVGFALKPAEEAKPEVKA